MEQDRKFIKYIICIAASVLITFAVLVMIVRHKPTVGQTNVGQTSKIAQTTEVVEFYDPWQRHLEGMQRYQEERLAQSIAQQSGWRYYWYTFLEYIPVVLLIVVFLVYFVCLFKVFDTVGILIRDVVKIVNYQVKQTDKKS